MSFGDRFADRYVSGGGNVEFRRLGSDFAGAFVLTIGSIWSGILLWIGEAIQGLLLSTAGFNADFVGALFGSPTRAINSAVSASIAFITGLGPLGFMGAVLLVLAGFFLVAEVLPDG